MFSLSDLRETKVYQEALRLQAEREQLLGVMQERIRSISVSREEKSCLLVTG